MNSALLSFKQTAKFDDKTKKVTITGPCTCTGVSYKVVISYQEYNDYYIRGMHVQNAMPKVSPDDREFLISGVSPKGWEELFGKE